MRILHLLSQTELTGAEVYAQNLIQSQAARGHQVFVISDKIHVDLAVKFSPMKISTSNFFVRMNNIRKLRKFLKVHHVDVIHCHSRGANRHAYWARLFLKTAIVTTLHGRQHFSLSKKFFDIYGEILLAVCENVRTSFKKSFAPDATHIRVLRNPIAKTETRRHKQTYHLALLGRSSGPKGERIEAIVKDCFGQWLETIRGLQVSVIASSPDDFSDDFIGQMKVLLEKYPDRIHLHGHIPDLRSQLKNYDLCLCSGRIAVESLLEGSAVFALGEHCTHGLVESTNIKACLASNFGDMGDGGPAEILNTQQITDQVLHFYSHPQAPSEQLKQLLVHEFDEKTIQPQVMDAYKAAIFKRHVPQWIPVLMYHKIPIESLQTKHRIFVTKERFEKHLKFFKKQNFRALTFHSLRRYWDLEKDYKEFPKKPLLLTFDDGYEDNLTNLQPLLKKYHMRATIFLLANHDIKENTWDAETGEEPHLLLNLSEKKELDQKYFEIGSHGFNHLHLPEAKPEEAVTEIVDSKSTLERDLETPVISFAYPFGSTNEYLPQVVREAGYRFAVNTDQGGLHLADQPFSIFRVNIFPEDNTFSLWRKTRPKYRMRFLKTRKR
jgi:peptidoglycan/xylan/chitin deacetylase (PgdA/CDA1 family)